MQQMDVLNIWAFLFFSISQRDILENTDKWSKKEAHGKYFAVWRRQIEQFWTFWIINWLDLLVVASSEEAIRIVSSSERW